MVLPAGVQVLCSRLLAAGPILALRNGADLLESACTIMHFLLDLACGLRRPDAASYAPEAWHHLWQQVRSGAARCSCTCACTAAAGAS